MVAVGEETDGRSPVGDRIKIEAAVRAAQHLQQADREAECAQRHPHAGHQASLPIGQQQSAHEHRRRRREGQQIPPRLFRSQAERKHRAAAPRHGQHLQDALPAGQAGPEIVGKRDELQQRQGGDRPQQHEGKPCAAGRPLGEQAIAGEHQQRHACKLDRREAERVGLAGAAKQRREHHQQQGEAERDACEVEVRRQRPHPRRKDERREAPPPG